jgi:hypothetical protein
MDADYQSFLHLFVKQKWLQPDEKQALYIVLWL